MHLELEQPNKMNDTILKQLLYFGAVIYKHWILDSNSVEITIQNLMALNILSLSIINMLYQTNDKLIIITIIIIINNDRLYTKTKKYSI